MRETIYFQSRETNERCFGAFRSPIDITLFYWVSQLSFTQITRQVAVRQHYTVPSCWMWDVIFSIQAEKVREEWWLNAGSHWEFDLIPQTGRIQNGNSCYHPFLCQGGMIARVEGSFSSLSPSLLFPSISFFLSSFLFLFRMSRNGNSVLKSYFLLLNLFFSLHFCLFITSFPFFLSLVFFSQSPWSSLRDFLSFHNCSLW